jgi:hypothetical protein
MSRGASLDGLGSLTVVGTGIQLASQTTPEARAFLGQADKVFFLVADPATFEWIRSLNPTAESLHGCYRHGQDRRAAYACMIQRILAGVRDGLAVCVASYGHPGVLAYPWHEAVRQARKEGFEARMLPGISAEACLYSDLGIDPGATGWQSYEATDFLVNGRRLDTRSSLLLWQIGVIGVLEYRQDAGLWNAEGLRVLTDVLTDRYGAGHQVTVYEAAHYPVCGPSVQHVALRDLPTARVTPISTLYVPPLASPAPDRQMLRRLGIRAATARRRA